MSFIGKNPNVNWLNLVPQSADPTSPNEGDLFYSDGTPRAEGIYIYKNAAWVEVLTSSNGSINVTTVTTTYAMTTSNDVVLANGTSGIFTITLPPAATSPFKEYTIKKIDATSNIITIDGSGSETIEGATSTTLDIPNQIIRLVSNGTSWYVTDKKPESIYARITYEVGSSINGGTPNANTYSTRPINTEYDPYNIVSISANQFTLGAGTWRIKANSVFSGVGFVRTRLRNVTDLSTTLTGTSEFSDSGSAYSQNSTIAGQFTITSAKAFEIQYYCGTNPGATGLGRPGNSGDNEVYLIAEIERIDN